LRELGCVFQDCGLRAASREELSENVPEAKAIILSIICHYGQASFTLRYTFDGSVNLMFLKE